MVAQLHGTNSRAVAFPLIEVRSPATCPPVAVVCEPLLEIFFALLLLPGLVGQRRPRWGADPPTHGMSLAERFEMYMAARAQQRGSSSGSSPPFAVSNSPESGSGSGTGDGSTSHPALEYKMTGLSDVCLGDDEVPMQTPDLIGQSMPLTITHAPPAPPEAV